MIRTLRLVLKLQRFEIIVLAIAIVALSSIAGLLSSQLSDLAARIAACQDPVACLPLQEEFAQLKLRSLPVAFLNTALPAFAGLIIGVPLVAREIERGTATLPWTMSPSRRSWYLSRILILGGVVAVLALLPSLTSEALASASNPGVDMGHSFREAATRGPIIAARAGVAFGFGVLAGVVLGRSLPALLFALVAVAAVLFGGQLANDAWLRAEAVPLAEDVSPDDSIVREVGYLLPDGRIVDWDSAWAALDDPNSNPTDAFPQRYIGVAADVAPEKRVREAALILITGFLALAAAAGLVERRRPY